MLLGNNCLAQKGRRGCKFAAPLARGSMAVWGTAGVIEHPAADTNISHEAMF